MLSVWIVAVALLQNPVAEAQPTQPKRSPTPLEWGMTAYQQGNNELALRYFTQAWAPQAQLVGLKGVDPTPLVWQAKCYAQLGDMPHAAQALNEATALAQPGSVAYRLATQALLELFPDVSVDDSTASPEFRQVLGGHTLPYNQPTLTPSGSVSVPLWQQPIVVWVQPTMPAFLLPKQAQRLHISLQEIENLLRQWQPALPNSIPITVTQDAFQASVRVEWVDSIENKNGSDFTSGLTQWKTNDSHHITQATVKIAVMGPSGQPRTKVALLQTTLHELGHALGLAQHSTQAGDIMAAHGVGSYHVSPNDLDRLQALYVSSNATPTSNPTLNPTATTLTVLP